MTLHSGNELIKRRNTCKIVSKYVIYSIKVAIVVLGLISNGSSSSVLTRSNLGIFSLVTISLSANSLPTNGTDSEAFGIRKNSPPPVGNVTKKENDDELPPLPESVTLFLDNFQLPNVSSSSSNGGRNRSSRQLRVIASALRNMGCLPKFFCGMNSENKGNSQSTLNDLAYLIKFAIADAEFPLSTGQADSKLKMLNPEDDAVSGNTLHHRGLAGQYLIAGGSSPQVASIGSREGGNSLQDQQRPSPSQDYTQFRTPPPRFLGKMAPAIANHMASKVGNKNNANSKAKKKSTLQTILSPFHRIYLRLGRSVDSSENHDHDEEHDEESNSASFEVPKMNFETPGTATSMETERVEKAGAFWKTPDFKKELKLAARIGQAASQLEKAEGEDLCSATFNQCPYTIEEMKGMTVGTTTTSGDKGGSGEKGSDEQRNAFYEQWKRIRDEEKERIKANQEVEQIDASKTSNNRVGVAPSDNSVFEETLSTIGLPIKVTTSTPTSPPPQPKKDNLEVDSSSEEEDSHESEQNEGGHPNQKFVIPPPPQSIPEVRHFPKVKDKTAEEEDSRELIAKVQKDMQRKIRPDPDKEVVHAKEPESDEEEEDSSEEEDERNEESSETYQQNLQALQLKLALAKLEKEKVVNNKPKKNALTKSNTQATKVQNNKNTTTIKTTTEKIESNSTTTDKMEKGERTTEKVLDKTTEKVPITVNTTVQPKQEEPEAVKENRIQIPQKYTLKKASAVAAADVKSQEKFVEEFEKIKEDLGTGPSEEEYYDDSAESSTEKDPLHKRKHFAFSSNPNSMEPISIMTRNGVKKMPRRRRKNGNNNNSTASRPSPTPIVSVTLPAMRIMLSNNFQETSAPTEIIITPTTQEIVVSTSTSTTTEPTSTTLAEISSTIMTTATQAITTQPPEPTFTTSTLKPTIITTTPEPSTTQAQTSESTSVTTPLPTTSTTDMPQPTIVSSTISTSTPKPIIILSILDKFSQQMQQFFNRNKAGGIANKPTSEDDEKKENYDIITSFTPTSLKQEPNNNNKPVHVSSSDPHDDDDDHYLPLLVNSNQSSNFNPINPSHSGANQSDQSINNPLNEQRMEPIINGDDDEIMSEEEFPNNKMPIRPQVIDSNSVEEMPLNIPQIDYNSTEEESYGIKSENKTLMISSHHSSTTTTTMSPDYEKMQKEHEQKMQKEIEKKLELEKKLWEQKQQKLLEEERRKELERQRIAEELERQRIEEELLKEDELRKELEKKRVEEELQKELEKKRIAEELERQRIAEELQKQLEKKLELEKKLLEQQQQKLIEEEKQKLLKVQKELEEKRIFEQKLLEQKLFQQEQQILLEQQERKALQQKLLEQEQQKELEKILQEQKLLQQKLLEHEQQALLEKQQEKLIEEEKQKLLKVQKELEEKRLFEQRLLEQEQQILLEQQEKKVLEQKLLEQKLLEEKRLEEQRKLILEQQRQKVREEEMQKELEKKRIEQEMQKEREKKLEMEKKLVEQQKILEQRRLEQQQKEEMEQKLLQQKKQILQEQQHKKLLEQQLQEQKLREEEQKKMIETQQQKILEQKLVEQKQLAQKIIEQKIIEQRQAEEKLRNEQKRKEQEQLMQRQLEQQIQQQRIQMQQQKHHQHQSYEQNQEDDDIYDKIPQKSANPYPYNLQNYIKVPNTRRRYQPTSTFGPIISTSTTEVDTHNTTPTMKLTQSYNHDHDIIKQQQQQMTGSSSTLRHNHRVAKPSPPPTRFMDRDHHHYHPPKKTSLETQNQYYMTYMKNNPNMRHPNPSSLNIPNKSFEENSSLEQNPPGQMTHENFNSNNAPPPIQSPKPSSATSSHEHEMGDGKIIEPVTKPHKPDRFSYLGNKMRSRVTTILTTTSTTTLPTTTTTMMTTSTTPKPSEKPTRRHYSSPNKNQRPAVVGKPPYLTYKSTDAPKILSSTNSPSPSNITRNNNKNRNNFQSPMRQGPSKFGYNYQQHQNQQQYIAPDWGNYGFPFMGQNPQDAWRQWSHYNNGPPHHHYGSRELDTGPNWVNLSSTTTIMPPTSTMTSTTSTTTTTFKPTITTTTVLPSTTTTMKPNKSDQKYRRTHASGTDPVILATFDKIDQNFQSQKESFEEEEYQKPASPQEQMPIQKRRGGETLAAAEMKPYQLQPISVKKVHSNPPESEEPHVIYLKSQESDDEEPSQKLIVPSTRIRPYRKRAGYSSTTTNPTPLMSTTTIVTSPPSSTTVHPPIFNSGEFLDTFSNERIPPPVDMDKQSWYNNYQFSSGSSNVKVNSGQGSDYSDEPQQQQEQQHSQFALPSPQSFEVVSTRRPTLSKPMTTTRITTTTTEPTSTTTSSTTQRPIIRHTLPSRRKTSSHNRVAERNPAVELQSNIEDNTNNSPDTGTSHRSRRKPPRHTTPEPSTTSTTPQTEATPTPTPRRKVKIPPQPQHSSLELPIADSVVTNMAANSRRKSGEVGTNSKSRKETSKKRNKNPAIETLQSESSSPQPILEEPSDFDKDFDNSKPLDEKQIETMLYNLMNGKLPTLGESLNFGGPISSVISSDDDAPAPSKPNSKGRSTEVVEEEEDEQLIKSEEIPKTKRRNSSSSKNKSNKSKKKGTTRHKRKGESSPQRIFKSSNKNNKISKQNRRKSSPSNNNVEKRVSHTKKKSTPISQQKTNSRTKHHYRKKKSWSLLDLLG